MRILHLAKYRPYLGTTALWRLGQQAREVTRHQGAWERRAVKDVRDASNRILDQMAEGGPFPRAALDALEKTLIGHMVSTMDLGLETAEEAVDDLDDRAPTKRLAKPPKVKIPRKMDDLRRFWDKVRGRAQAKKDADLTKRARTIYERTRKAYLDRVQSIWDKYGAEWRNGDVGSKSAAIEAMQKATGSTVRRVKTIIETETTYYYNSTREAYYSQSDAITHYLFLAVRDHATTKWCKSRHGKVFEKGTVLFQQNIPPCHWNCRSEIVPLTMYNPRHRLLIEDKSKRATRANIVPLPPGWGNRAA